MTGSHEVRGSIPLGSTNIGSIKGIPLLICTNSVKAEKFEERSPAMSSSTFTLRRKRPATPWLTQELELS